jgi:threonine aldolase
MANLIALLVHARPGDEVVLETEAHLVYYESGSLAAVAGLMPLLVPGDRGVLVPASIEQRLRKPNIHYPRTSVLCVENTHNRAGGTVTSAAVMHELRELCDRHDLKLHVDGARIFNAAVSLRTSVHDLVVDADSVAISLTKGLCAPVGALLGGKVDFIDAARRKRKMLGGGMRQAGVIAAAGLVALSDGIDRLAEDHARARDLASRLSELSGLRVEGHVETNMVLINTADSGLDADSLVAALKTRSIRASSRPPYTVRFVTHRQIGDEEVTILINALEEILGRPSG